MYIPLYNKTNYNLLGSTLKVDDLINYAINNKLPSISICDTNMFATMQFIKKCHKNNIKPLIGLELNLENLTIIIFCKDYIGYQSMIKLSTIQNERTPLIEDLVKYNKNLIGILPFEYRNNYNKIKNIYKELFLGYTNKKEAQELLQYTSNIIFFRESLYLNKEDEYILSYLYLIRDGKTISDKVNYDTKNHELNITNINDLTDNIGLLNTIKISNSCNIIFPKPQNLLPIYDCEDPKAYLFQLCKVGLNKRLNGIVPITYQKRLLYELKTINEMGFANYFLIVYDYIKYAKKNNILVGPGRGSAAGSLVAYSLGITDIDPLKYDLLFERFLNPERKTMPDIDTDFPDNKRDQVVNYVKEKYGEKRVSGIITFGTMAAKQAIRDTSRVMNIPLYKVDKVCKFIPAMTKDKLQDIYNKNVAFRTYIDSDITLKNMFKIALKLEGFPRHTSSHAAGIVMSRVDLDEVLPLYKTEDIYLTSYSMEYLEQLGLLKMDFLVLKNLTLIDNILTDIKNIYHKDINFSKIPLDDKETLELFKTGNTCGIFQFESSGMRAFLRRLKPTTFDDIFAAIALFRPGASASIDTYIRRKHGQEKVAYLDPSLESVTKSTYGILIYQEQIMQLASNYAGYTLGEADILRRAMSKKKLDLLKGEEEKFITKSISKGHPKEQAKKLFNLVLNFAGYGFNKSHSVVYSVIAYKMAYLKCHYKTIFFSNLLTSVIGSETKTNEYILEAKANKIEILKPTINNCYSKYIVHNNKIIYPISNIKSITSLTVTQINNAKKEKDFEDIYDCISRLYIAGITKKTIEKLIYAGLFDGFNLTRKTLIENLDSLYNYAELTKDIDPSLVIKPEIENYKEFSNSILLEKEKELFGFYISSHPTTFYKKANPYTININQIENYYNKQVDTLILVEKIKEITTKKGDKMSFITGSDETGTIEYILFPKQYNKYNNITKGNILKVRGTVERRLNETQIIINRIKLLEGEINHE